MGVKKPKKAAKLPLVAFNLLKLLEISRDVEARISFAHDGIDSLINIVSTRLGEIIAIRTIRTTVGLGRKCPRRSIEIIISPLHLQNLLHHKRSRTTRNIFIQEKYRIGFLNGSQDRPRSIERQK